VTYSRDALGQVIAELREGQGLTQQQLGELAKYKPGAGAAVSVSRVESGRIHPGDSRRGDIAEALGVTQSELEAAAEQRTQEIASGRVPAGRGAAAAARAADLAARATSLEKKIRARVTTYEHVVAAFVDAYERSLDDFFFPLVDISSEIDAAVEPLERAPGALPSPDLRPEIAERFRLARGGVSAVALASAQFTAVGGSKAVGQLAAYGALQSVVALGRAGTGRKLSSLHGAAQLRGALARAGGGPLASGGRGMAGGQARLDKLATGVAYGLPALVASIATARRLWKEQRLSDELDQIESAFRETARSYEAIADLLPRATAVLDHVAVHGARALERWKNEVGANRRLEPGAQHEQRYRGFIDLSSCQVVIGAIDIEQLLESRGSEREDLIAAIDEDVNWAQATVTQIV